MSTAPYTVIRSNRKTVALVVNNEAELVVRAPFHISDKEIADFVHKKQNWITEKQLQVSAFGEKHNPIVVADGQTIMYLGNTYVIHKSNCSSISTDTKVMYVPHGYTLNDTILWLKEEAQHMIKERVEFYATLMGVHYTSLKLSEAKRRWGSCSAKNNLNFAWRLIMCPMVAIDYIVVHELSHIVYKNHGKEFWARVKTVQPHYKEQQEWLKINRKLMEII